MSETDRIDNTEYALLMLLRAAMHGSTAGLPQETDWARLFRLADRQNVLPMIVEAAWRSGVPEKLTASLWPAAMKQVAAQTRRTAAFLSLYRALAAEGHYPIVLKGLVCRLLYPEPDMRPSSDEDLHIGPEDLSAVHDALLEYGLRCVSSDPSKEDDEITYTGPDLHIELHLRAFAEKSPVYGSWNALFEGFSSRTVMIDAAGVPVRMMSPSDHLLFLICHACKHFLHTGVGIRQVCDIVLFAEHYGTKIDWEHVRAGCEKIHIAGFASAVFAIGARWLGVDEPAAFADPETDEQPMLKDMFSGGVYGAADENRAHSAVITLDAAAKRKRCRADTGIMASLFPPLDSMKEKYEYLKKYPWLLPAAWIRRIAHYLSRWGRGADPAESIRIGRERVALLKLYGIID